MRRPLLVAATLFVMGEVAARVMDTHPVYSIGLAASSIILSAMISNRNALTRRNNLLLFLMLLMMSVSGAVWCYGYYYGKNEIRSELAGYVSRGDTVKMSLLISSAENTASGMRLTLKLRKGLRSEPLTMYVKGEDVEKSAKSDNEVSGEKTVKMNLEVNGGMSVRVDREARLEPGRYITVTGKLVEIEGATNPGQMDMQEYYISRGIMYQIKADHYEVSEKVANPVALNLGRFRRKAAEYIDRYFGAEEAGIIKNMILGDRSGMSPKTRILYQRNGIAHILAISGLHIMLLASFLEWVLSKMYVKKNVASMITIFFMLLYAVMTGMSHATMRALLMLVIGRSAFAVKRTPDMPTSMAEALLVMMMINPDCIFSMGMLMSFAALGGVWVGYLVYEKIYGNERFKSVPQVMRPLAKRLCMGSITTFSISLMLTPMLIMSNFEIPLFSMVLNLVITSFLSFVIGCGFVVIVMGFLFDALGMIGIGLGAVGGVGADPVGAGAVGAGAVGAGAVGAGGVCGAVGGVDGAGILIGGVDGAGILIGGVDGAGILVGGVDIVRVIVSIPVGVATLILRFYSFLCERIPTSSIVITGHLEVWQVVVAYLLIALALMMYLDERKWKRIGRGRQINFNRKIKLSFVYVMICSGLIMGLAGVAKIYNLTFRGVVFLDVGQGDGSIIRSSAGRNYIIDCGSSDREEIGRYTLVPALKYFGMGRVDAVMVSHTDMDHVGGIVELIEERELYGIKVNAVVVAAGTEEDENYARIRRAFEGVSESGKEAGRISEAGERSERISEAGERSGRISEAGERSGRISEAGERFERISEAGAGDEIDGVFEVIYPERGSGEQSGKQSGDGQEEGITQRSGNDYSLVLNYREGDVEILYTGDIGAEVESNILDKISKLERPKLRILKCAHHGSKYSSSGEFLEAYRPDVTVISSGRNNYGHPSPVTIRRLEKTGTRIIRTDTSGAVILKLGNGGRVAK